MTLQAEIRLFCCELATAVPMSASFSTLWNQKQIQKLTKNACFQES